MARKFQGYARGRGFQRRDPGYGSLRRLEEQQRSVVRSMQDQAKERRQQAQQQISDLDANFKLGESIKGDIKQFEDKTYKVQQENKRIRAEQEIKNIEALGKGSTALYEQLGEFSDTLFEGVQKIAKNEEEMTYTSDLLDDSQEPTEPEVEAKAVDQEQTLIANSNTLNKAVFDSEIAPVAKEQVAIDDPALNYTSISSQVEAAGQAFQQRLQFGDDVRVKAIEVMREFGLNKLNRRQIRKFGDLVESTEKTHLETKNNLRAQKHAGDRQVKLLDGLRNYKPSPESNQFFIDGLASLHLDGKNPQGYEDGWEDFSDHLSQPDFPLSQVEAIFDQTIPEGSPGAGKKYRDFYKKQYSGILAKRSEIFTKQVDDQEKLLKARSQKEYLAAEAVLRETGTITDYEAYALEINNDTTLLPEHKRKLLEAAYDRSTKKKNGDQAMAIARQRARAGEDISSLEGLISAEDMPEYEKLQAARQKGLAESGVPPKSDIIKDTAKVVENTIANIAEFKSSAVSPSAKLVINQIIADNYNTFFSENFSRTGDYGAAHLFAVGKTTELATSNLSRYKLGFDKFKQIDFINYRKPEYVGSINDAMVMREIKNDPSIISSSPIMLRDTAFAIANAYVGDSVPPANRIYDSLTHEQKQAVMDFNSKNFGTPKVTVPLSTKDAAAKRAQDPRLKMFINILNTPVDQIKLPAILDQTQRPFYIPEPNKAQAQVIRSSAAVKPLREVIIGAEGLDYNGANRGIAGDTPGGVPGLDRKTVSQWRELYQTYNVLGGPQFKESTFNEIVERLGVPDTQVMDEETQVRFFDELIIGGWKRPVLTSYLRGETDDFATAAKELAQEFASVATSEGKSYYDGVAGNSSSITYEQALLLLNMVRERL
jgi:hypothetical protein